MAVRGIGCHHGRHGKVAIMGADGKVAIMAADGKVAIMAVDGKVAIMAVDGARNVALWRLCWLLACT
jgi:hypothetical protein